MHNNTHITKHIVKQNVIQFFILATVFLLFSFINIVPTYASHLGDKPYTAVLKCSNRGAYKSTGYGDNWLQYSTGAHTNNSRVTYWLFPAKLDPFTMEMDIYSTYENNTNGIL